MNQSDIEKHSLEAYPPVYGKDSADIFYGFREAWIEGAKWVLDTLLGESFEANVSGVIDRSSPRHYHIAKFTADFGTLPVPVKDRTTARIVIVNNGK